MMSKIENLLKCQDCGALKQDQEFASWDPDCVCLICNGATSDFDWSRKKWHKGDHGGRHREKHGGRGHHHKHSPPRHCGSGYMGGPPDSQPRCPPHRRPMCEFPLNN